MKPGVSPKTHLDEDCYSTTRFLFEIDEDDKKINLKTFQDVKEKNGKQYIKQQQSS